MNNRKTIEVSGDNVRFSFYAPNAKKVQVQGITGSMKREKINLEPEGNGYFSKEVTGIKNGFHYIDYFVDDVMVRNQEGNFCYGCFSAINYFELPDKKDEFWFLKDVPHGTLHYEMYASDVNDRMKQCIVYTPPGYEKDTKKNYPVLYLQHGVGENETGWINNGKMNFILDNMIAQKKSNEMIVVLNSGYAFEKGKKAVFFPGDFDRQLIEECIPFIDNKYRTINDKRGRALAGLSLGAAQMLETAVNHPEMFSYLGLFSGANSEKLDKIIEGKLGYSEVFLSAGTGEKELCELLSEYESKLNKAGILAEFHSYKGFHEWSPWRESLRDFAGIIFKDCSYAKSDLDQNILENKYTLKTYEQTMESDLLFFDPVYKNIDFQTDSEGRVIGTYIDAIHGNTISDNGNATINFYAPLAEEVKVNLYEKNSIVMKKNQNGYFSAEIQDIEPGFYYYDISVNGTKTVNLQAPVAFLKGRAVNCLEILQKDFEEYMLRDIPHGTIHRFLMRSNQEEGYKLCYVYTPPGYEKTNDLYPVIYLRNNENEDETSWIYQGRFNYIMDNMIYDQKCKKAIVAVIPHNIFRQDENKYMPSELSVKEITDELKLFLNERYRVKDIRDNIFGTEDEREYTDWTMERKKFMDFVSEKMPV